MIIDIKLSDYSTFGVSEQVEVLNLTFIDKDAFVLKNWNVSLSTKELFINSGNLVDPSKINLYLSYIDSTLENYIGSFMGSINF